jgi:hypothetical protein
MMSPTYFLPLVISCAATVEPSLTPSDERVAAIDSVASFGAITAERRVSLDAWASQNVSLSIATGSVEWRSGDAATLEALSLVLDPIEIPSDVLGYPVQLTEIELSLTEPVRIADHTTLPLTLTWSLTNHGVTSPLGSPDLPAISAAIEVGADTIDIRVASDGLLWEWASLLRLRDFSLSLASSR